jgi:hypothetical protein
MIGKISIIFLVLSLCSLIDGKRSFLNDNNDLELRNEEAQTFLQSNVNDDTNNDDSLDKREFGKNCVPCKFKINPCCAPNVCRKKFPWNECMEIKVKTRDIEK